MILLYKYYSKQKYIRTNDIIIYLGLLLIILYFSRTLFLLISILDLYIHLFVTNFTIIINTNKQQSDLKMEIVAEGVSKKETDNLVNTLIEYSEKFNIKGTK